MRARYSPELNELLDRQASQTWISTQEDPLTFVLCAARTGSTLFRLLLNRHPEVACPPETNIGAAVRTLGQSWMSANKGTLPDSGVDACRNALIAPLSEYAKERGKSLWCDKSLSNALHAEMLSELFPEARFVCLYRNCMDMVVSGINACRWGYDSYGFEPYARASPDNLAVAMVRYWIDQTELIRRFERTHGGICYRLYYESLVTEPELTMKGLLSFLGLAWANEVIQPSYAPREDLGFGDHKTVYLEQLDDTRIGAGNQVPVQALPPPLLVEVNNLLVDLGYPDIGPDWNRTRSRLRVYGGIPRGINRLKEAIASGLDIVASSTNSQSTPSLSGVDLRFQSFRLIVEDAPYPDGDWCIDLRTWQLREFDNSEPGGVDFHILGSSSALLAIAEQRLNIGDALRANEIRIFPTHENVDEVPYSIARFLATLLTSGADITNLTTIPANQSDGVSGSEATPFSVSDCDVS